MKWATLWDASPKIAGKRSYMARKLCSGSTTGLEVEANFRTAPRTRAWEELWRRIFEYVEAELNQSDENTNASGTSLIEAE